MNRLRTRVEDMKDVVMKIPIRLTSSEKRIFIHNYSLWLGCHDHVDTKASGWQMVKFPERSCADYTL